MCVCAYEHIKSLLKVRAIGKCSVDLLDESFAQKFAAQCILVRNDNEKTHSTVAVKTKTDL